MEHQTLPDQGHNEVVIRQEDLNDFEKELENLVNLTSVVKSAQEALSDSAKELQDKYKQHPHFNFKAAQMKKMASILLEDNLDEERDKVLTIFDTLQALEDKE